MSKINPPKVFGSESLDDAIKLLKDLKTNPESPWQPELSTESMAKYTEIMDEVGAWFDNKCNHFQAECGNFFAKVRDFGELLLIFIGYVALLAGFIFIIGGISKILLHAWRYY